MSARFYPDVDQRMMIALTIWGEADGDYWNRSPYSTRDRELLASIFRPREGEEPAGRRGSGEPETELDEILGGLWGYRDRLDQDDPRQIAAYLRLAATLVERIARPRTRTGHLADAEPARGRGPTPARLVEVPRRRQGGERGSG